MKKILFLICSFVIVQNGFSQVTMAGGSSGAWSIGFLLGKNDGTRDLWICIPWISICKLPNVIQPFGDGDNEESFICTYNYDKQTSIFKMKVNHNLISEEDKVKLMSNNFKIESYEGSLGFNFNQSYKDYFNLTEGLIHNGSYPIDNSQAGYSTIIFNNVK